MVPQSKSDPCVQQTIPTGAEEVNTSELIPRLTDITRYAKETGIVIPVFIYGGPGVGKTEIVNQIGKELGAKVETYIASTMDPTEIRGIPVPLPRSSPQYSEWLPQKNWLTAKNDFKIYFFDELNLAPASTQAAFYRLILEGKLDTIDISKSMRIAAGNRSSDVSTIRNLSLPLATRFEMYWLTPNLQGWLRWASTHGIRSEVMDYLTEYPNQLYCVNPGMQDIAKATPRGWERVSNLLKIGLNKKEDIAGSIGLDPALKFLAWLAQKPVKGPVNLGEL